MQKTLEQNIKDVAAWVAGQPTTPVQPVPVDPAVIAKAVNDAIAAALPAAFQPVIDAVSKVAADVADIRSQVDDTSATGTADTSGTAAAGAGTTAANPAAGTATGS